MPAPRTNPGETHETPTPWSAMSRRSDRENPRRPNLVAVYTDESGLADFPCSDETNTM
jgi:hypothetical protein